MARPSPRGFKQRVISATGTILTAGTSISFLKLSGGSAAASLTLYDALSATAASTRIFRLSCPANGYASENFGGLGTWRFSTAVHAVISGTGALAAIGHEDLT